MSLDWPHMNVYNRRAQLLLGTGIRVINKRLTLSALIRLDNRKEILYEQFA
jgi:hypothetical protein